MPGKPLSDREVERATRLREGGATFREIGAALGRDEKTIRRALGKSGRPGGPRRDITIEQVVGMRRQGMGVTAIAAELECSLTLVTRRLAEAGEMEWPSWMRPTAGERR